MSIRHTHRAERGVCSGVCNRRGSRAFASSVQRGLALLVFLLVVIALAPRAFAQSAASGQAPAAGTSTIEVSARPPAAASQTDDDDDDEAPPTVPTRPRRRGRFLMRTAPGWTPAAGQVESVPPPAPTRLALGSWQLGVGFDTVWRIDPSYDYLVERGMTPALVLAAAREITRPSSRWIVGAEVSWRYAALSGQAASALLTGQTSHVFVASVIARWAAVPFFAPYVRLGGGGGIAQTRMASDTNNPLTDVGGFAVGSLGAGIYLRSTGVIVERGAASNLGFALAVEGGMQLASAIPVNLTQNVPVDPSATVERIPVRSVQVGAVSPTGPYLHVRFDVRF